MKVTAELIASCKRVGACADGIAWARANVGADVPQHYAGWVAVHAPGLTLAERRTLCDDSDEPAWWRGVRARPRAGRTARAMRRVGLSGNVARQDGNNMEPKMRLDATLWLEIPTPELVTTELKAGISAMREVFERVAATTNAPYDGAIEAMLGPGSVAGYKAQHWWLERGMDIDAETAGMTRHDLCLLEYESIFAPDSSKPSLWNSIGECRRIGQRLADNLPVGPVYVLATVPGPTGRIELDYDRREGFHAFASAFRNVGHRVRAVTAKYARPDRGWSWPTPLDVSTEIAGIWSYHSGGVLQPGFWQPNLIPAMVCTANVDDETYGLPLVYTGLSGCTPAVAAQILEGVNFPKPAPSDEAKA